jgi:hypothetical protein
VTANDKGCIKKISKEIQCLGIIIILIHINLFFDIYFLLPLNALIYDLLK